MSFSLRRVLCCLPLLLPLSGRAQIPQRNEHAIDSLRQEARLHPNDTVGARALVSLMYYLLYNDTARAGQYGRRALALATRLHDTRRLARVHYNLGTLAAMAGRHEASIRHHLASARYFYQLRNPLWAGHNYRNIGSRYSELGRYEDAMRYLVRSLRLRQAAADSGGIADSYLMMGQLYLMQRNYPAAQAAYEQALARWQRLGVRAFVVDAINHLAIIHRDQGRYARAESYLQQGLNTLGAGGDSAATAGLLVSLGVLHQKQGEWAASLPPLLRAEQLVVRDKLTNPQFDADVLACIGTSYVMVDQEPRAQRYLQRALRVARQSKIREEEVDALTGLALLAARRRDFAGAYQYQRQLSLINDTLRSEAAARSVTEMQAKYDAEQKDARNRIQALQLREQALLVRKRNAQLLAAGAALLLALVGGWSLYKRRALRQQLALEQQRQLLERQRAAAVLEAEENERRRIGSDLHDGLGQLLSAAKLNLHALDQQLGPRLNGHRELLANAVAVVDESFREVRGISHNLMPNALLRRGLVAAVRDFLDKLPSTGGLRIEVQAFGLDATQLPPTTESVLFRVIQELVQNIIKHAQATDVTIQLVRSDDELTVTVEDNGVGFSPQALGPEAGIGLRNVETRMAYLGGQAHFDAAPGRGTTVTLEVPLPQGDLVT
ncbi:tetratricopeptide repeat protein [Hymenobacter gummosus]|uniref:Oxygen sensor histidine kinase NreB n=1 Tax=Hymenobacter gummosus TaxID=1776032 RepID=A0A3S0H5U5_9BACT|nr:tetratricopeptide repeat protein [Hymenobacter gummosus]RTQ49137.1 tetratricopeptide repeat protein [Hymenobacter gummosus]